LRRVSIGALVAVSALVVAAVLAASGRASDPNVTFTATDTLDPVTAGLAAELVFGIRNLDNGTLTHAKVSYPLPAGSSFVSASASQGSCNAVGGTVLCDLGKVSSGKTASATIRITVPSATFTSCGTLTFKEGKHDTDSSHLDTLQACQTTQVRAANDPNYRAGCIASGETISTGSQATATDRQNTAITTPGGACVSVGEVPAASPTDACGVGATCKTDVSEIIHPPCSAAAPCRIVVTFDSSFGEIKKLYYNNIRVEPCTTPGVASPDPCIVSRNLVRSLHTGGKPKDTQFVILSAIDARLRGG
jgi:hypothetical protein